MYMKEVLLGMSVEKRVVVVVPVERLYNQKRKAHAARIRALGITAYGNAASEAQDKVKQMFGAYVRAHRKEGTLEFCLRDSGLPWCWEDEYKGKLPVEWVSFSPGDDNPIWECVANESHSWRTVGELALA